MRPKNKNDKVVDDTSNEETMKSTCRQVKKEDKEIPHSYKNAYCTSHRNRVT